MSTMKAIRIEQYGGPEVMRYVDIEVPEPNAGEVLVKVAAAGVDPVDYKIRQGHFLARTSCRAPSGVSSPARSNGWARVSADCSRATRYSA